MYNPKAYYNFCWCYFYLQSTIRTFNSAGRRKAKEQRSEIIPKKKDTSPRAASKPRNKRPELSKSTDQSNDGKGPTKPGSKPTKGAQKDAAGREKPAKQVNSRTKDPKPTKRVNGKPKAVHESKQARSEVEEAGVINQAQLQSLLQTLQNVDPSLLASMGLTKTAAKENDGGDKIVRANETYQPTSDTRNVVEPDFIPGMTLILYISAFLFILLTIDDYAPRGQKSLGAEAHEVNVDFNVLSG